MVFVVTNRVFARRTHAKGVPKVSKFLAIPIVNNTLGCFDSFNLSIYIGSEREGEEWDGARVAKLMIHSYKSCIQEKGPLITGIQQKK